ncbi:response regulator [Mucilaginibacter robiniae]|uniref:Response regulator n=1 Tax=Mucilaginibacter robiniae TaxID=2728022 RepID=A0A7L5DTG2_9SPHI|nr:response regulator [Mucilaginibacter robiniae]QJD94395.1 response regulator [Mucilaginibacter robiniae]
MSLLPKIFIIDDDMLFVFLTKKMIQTIGFTADITEFQDGLEGLEHLKKISSQKEQLPDLIFLDLNMPVMDGWEFVEEFKTIQPDLAKKVKLYIFSSSISPYDIERAKELSVVDDFIIKPLTQDKFMNIMQDA